MNIFGLYNPKSPPHSSLMCSRCRFPGGLKVIMFCSFFLSSKQKLLIAYKLNLKGLTCLPQRAALLKSMLNFLKKAIQDPAFRYRSHNSIYKQGEVTRRRIM